MIGEVWDLKLVGHVRSNRKSAFKYVVFVVCYSAIREVPCTVNSNVLNIVHQVLIQKQIHWGLLHDKIFTINSYD